LSELCWFLAGVVVGSLHVLTVRWTVGALRPGETGRALMVVLVGALLRTVAVVTVLMIALAQALVLGLLALAGFIVSRTACTAIMASRLANTSSSPDG